MCQRPAGGRHGAACSPHPSIPPATLARACSVLSGLLRYAPVTSLRGRGMYCRVKLLWEEVRGEPGEGGRESEREKEREKENGERQREHTVRKPQLGYPDIHLTASQCLCVSIL